MTPERLAELGEPSPESLAEMPEISDLRFRRLYPINQIKEVVVEAVKAVIDGYASPNTEAERMVAGTVLGHAVAVRVELDLKERKKNSMKQSIDDLRRTVDRSNPRQVQMLAAIDAVTALVGDNHAQILGVLHGAWVTVAHATQSPDGVFRLAVASLRREMAALHEAGPALQILFPSIIDHLKQLEDGTTVLTALGELTILELERFEQTIDQFTELLHKVKAGRDRALQRLPSTT